jgi:RNA polymerase sigma factor (sigma-70 family)
MLNGHLDPILRHIRALAGERTAAATDAELLERFATRRDEAAFAALVERYGGLVFGVCRRVLRHSHDAEDAFQATFLILAHKAASVHKRASAASWLYGVAYRVAVRAKTDGVRRRKYEKRAPTMRVPEPQADVIRCELQRVVDEELSRLPERYRAPLVLCCLAGKTQEQAARELGWPLGSMSRWLTRGKELLRKRLARRGVTISTALLGAALAEMAAEAAPAATLTSTTIKAAVLSAAGLISARVAALTEGVLRTMVLTKFKIATCLLVVVGVVAAGAGALALQTTGESDRSAPRSEGELPGKEADKKDSPKTEFVKAEVKVLMGQNGHLRETPLQFTLADPKQIARLAEFFPEMGKGKVSNEAAGWKAGIQIQFHRAKGDPLKVNVHWEGEVWSEGRGDWDAKPGLWKYLAALIAEEDLNKLQGTWKVVSVADEGKVRRDADIKDLKWSFRGNRLTYWESDRRHVFQATLDPSTQPKSVDLTDEKAVKLEGGKTAKINEGIYSLEGDDLKVHIALNGKTRPADFSNITGDDRTVTSFSLYTLKRESEVKPDAAPEAEKRSRDRGAEWSKPVNGLSGRLVVTFEDLKPGLRHAVTLELRNVSTEQLAVLNRPVVEVSLSDAAGESIPPSLPRSMSGPIPNPQWAVLPRDAYMGFRVDMTTVGVPAKDFALLAVQGKTWDLKPGSYTLRAKLIVKEKDLLTWERDLRPPVGVSEWIGQLELPHVEIVVTKEQVAEK